MDALKDKLGYYDLCVPEESYLSTGFDKMAKTYLEYGFRTIAINQIVDDANVKTKRKKEKADGKDDIVPAPVKIDKIYTDEVHKLNILRRLTIIFGNQDVIHKINNSANFKKYDLIAVQPTTQAAYQYTCSNIFADILSVNNEGKLAYKMNRKLYTLLGSKGFHYELLYAPAIKDSSHRKNIINLAHLYHSFGKSRHIIISSNATNNLYIRSPHDIMNLGLILGLDQQKCREAILDNGKAVYLSAVGRRHGKAVMFVTDEKIEQSTNGTKASQEEDEDNEEVNDQGEQEESMDVEDDEPALKKPKQ